jgi:hypothetical protein
VRLMLRRTGSTIILLVAYYEMNFIYRLPQYKRSLNQ